MASRTPIRLVTSRDFDILTALNHCPLTAIQLLAFSQTFEQPFTDERRVRARLTILCEAGRVRRWQYATAGRGAPNYYTLSPLGYQLLHGEGASPPSKRAFEPVGIAHQRHTHSLAEFLVHTIVAAHRGNLTFTNFYRENTLRLPVGEEHLLPDSSFQLIERDGTPYSFLIEIDGGSERVRSAKDLDSWERKIRLYDRLQDLTDSRFRVLIVSIRSTVRIGHILDAAAKLVRNPDRSLFYGISLPAYLVESEPLEAACFRDHRGRAVALVPRRSPRSDVSPQRNAALAIA